MPASDYTRIGFLIGFENKIDKGNKVNFSWFDLLEMFRTISINTFS